MAVRNTCQCENPPGGITECDISQTAYCIVKDGVARHVCVTPQGHDPVQQLKSVYYFVTGDVIGDVSLTPSMIEFFLGGRYQDYVQDRVVTFNLPSYLKDFLSGLDKGSSGSGGTPVEPDRPMFR